MSGSAIVSGAVELHLFDSSRQPGRSGAFLVLLAFLLSFAFIRTSARLMRSPRVPWWPGSVKAGGVHVHHLVWGISLLLISGFVAFASGLYSPWWQITAIAFGIGAGLTLDEFALWVYLEDVYWAKEGRDSIDAVIVATVLAGLVVLGLRPFGLDDTGSLSGTAFGVALALVPAGITFFKGRLVLGAIALFVPVVGLYTASRLARPGSPWARTRYTGARAGRLERARDRFARHGRLEERLRDAIGGAPSADAEPEAPARAEPHR